MITVFELNCDKIWKKFGVWQKECPQFLRKMLAKSLSGKTNGGENNAHRVTVDQICCYIRIKQPKALLSHTTEKTVQAMSSDQLKARPPGKNLGKTESSYFQV